MRRTNLWKRVATRITLLWAPLLFVLPIASHGQEVEVEVAVLGVPGHERLIQDLREAGYSAYRYGPAGRPAEGFQVITLGDAVPPLTAIEIVRMARRRIPSLSYIVLNGDRPRSPSEADEISIGGTNGIMDPFPEAEPLSASDFTELLSAARNDPGRLHELVRAAYTDRETAETSDGPRDIYIREDGVVVIPNEDGTATLRDADGRRGVRGQDGQERWLMANLAQLAPVTQGGQIDDEWVQTLNAWMEWLGDRLLEDLEILLGDEEALRNYVAHEDRECDTLYERVHMRRKYLTLIIDNRYR